MTSGAQTASIGLITLVTNKGAFGSAGIKGPGHSALYIRGTCYSFDQVAHNSWRVLALSSYLQLGENIYRPVILTELAGVDSDKARGQVAIDFKKIFTFWWADNYCSLQTHEVINVGSGGMLGPAFVHEFPRDLYLLIHDRGLTTGRQDVIWAKRSQLTSEEQGYIENKLVADYDVQEREINP